MFFGFEKSVVLASVSVLCFCVGFVLVGGRRGSFFLVYSAVAPLPSPLYRDCGAATLGWCGNTPTRVVAACLGRGDVAEEG